MKKPRASQGYQSNAWLDAVLTASLANSGIAAGFLLDRHDLAWMCLSFMATVFFLNATKQFFAFAAPYLGTAEAVSKKRNVQKFADQGWQLVVHVLMVVVEALILSQDNWRTWHDTRLAWVDLFPTDPLTRGLYLAQLGVWFYTTFSHRFLEARHKDYYVMFIHHIATIALVLGSYTCGFSKIGVLVLFLHDGSDVFVDALKMSNYMGLDSNSGYFLTEIFFAINLVAWVVCRLFWYPVKLVWSAWFESVVVFNELPGKEAGANPFRDGFELLRDGRPQDSIMRLSLLLLVGLHAWWWYLFLRILVKLIRGNDTHSAGRDEYEGASSATEDEAEPVRDRKKA